MSWAGLVSIVALAERCGLRTLLINQVKLTAKGGANAATKILAIVAGMVAGADSIDDLDLLRHGGMARLFDGSAPRRRWGLSCGCSPSATSASSTPSPPGC